VQDLLDRRGQTLGLGRGRVDPGRVDAISGELARGGVLPDDRPHRAVNPRRNRHLAEDLLDLIDRRAQLFGIRCR
jgi:hypothetical protein